MKYRYLKMLFVMIGLLFMGHTSILVSANAEKLPFVINQATALSDGGEWVQYGGKWKYKFTDGSFAVNRWVKISGKYYHFDADGWMQTGWLKDNGYWYFLNKNGEMLTGWIELSQGTYYCDSSGRMLSSCWKETAPPRTIYGRVYKEKGEYWAYFNASGLMTTDSDMPGCSSGLNDLSHYSYAKPVNSIKYYIGTDSSIPTSSFAGGMTLWAQNTEAAFSRTYDSSNADLFYFNDYEFSDSDIRAATAFFDSDFENFRVTRNCDKNWYYCEIFINAKNYSNIGTDTIAHEIGHMFGLSHRVSELNSIMQKFHFVDADNNPVDDMNYEYLSTDDIAVFNHLH